MACFQRAGADLEQEWCQQDEVVPADEDDLDVPPALAKFLQAASRGHSPEAAAKDHDPGLFGHRHVTSPGRTSRFAAGAYSTDPAPITVTSSATASGTASTMTANAPASSSASASWTSPIAAPSWRPCWRIPPRRWTC